MSSMLLSLWTRFRQWVSVDWSQTTFFIILGVLVVCALLLLQTFLKKSTKGKGIKWASVVLLILLLGIVALLSVARFTN